MAPYMVFYGVKAYEEHQTWPKMVPRGAIIREQYGIGKPVSWYRTITVKHNVALNLSDIPAEVKTLCLILNLPL